MRARVDAAVDWKGFYEAHFDLVWRLLARFGAPREDLEDLTQEVFAVVHRKLPAFRRDAAVTTWLFTICRKVASSARRRALVRRVARSLLGGHAPPVTATDPGIHLDLARVLDRLSEIKRVTLLLHEVDGMSPSEIAVLFGCPEATVWSRLRVAWDDLERLREDEQNRGTR